MKSWQTWAGVVVVSASLLGAATGVGAQGTTASTGTQTVHKRPTAIQRRVEAQTVAVLAKLSGKTVAEVRSLKKQDQSWVKVAASLGLSSAVWNAERRVIAAQARRSLAVHQAEIEVLAKASNQSSTAVATVLKSQKTLASAAAALHLDLAAVQAQIVAKARLLVLAREIHASMTAALAKEAHSTVQAVTALKKSDKSWSATAQALHVSSQQQALLMQRVRQNALRRQLMYSDALRAVSTLSGKTPSALQALGVTATTWPAKIATLGLTESAVQAQLRHDVGVALRNQERNAQLLQFLVKLSGKPAASISAMKTTGKTWVDVAKELGY